MKKYLSENNEEFKNLTYENVVFYRDKKFKVKRENNKFLKTDFEINKLIKLMNTADVLDEYRFDDWIEKSQIPTYINNAKSVETLKCFLISKINEVAYTQNFDMGTEKSFKNALVPKKDVYKNNKMIINGPAGSGKSIMMIEKTLKVIKEDKENSSLTLLYSCLTEKNVKCISMAIKSIKKKKNQPVPKFYIYREFKTNEINISDSYFYDKYNIFIHLRSLKTITYFLLQHPGGNEECKDSVIVGFPYYYHDLFTIFEKFKFNDIKDKITLRIDSIDCVSFATVVYLSTCFKQLYIRDMLNEDSSNANLKNDLQSKFERFKIFSLNQKNKDRYNFWEEFFAFDGELDTLLMNKNGSLDEILDHLGLKKYLQLYNELKKVRESLIKFDLIGNF